MPDRLIWKNSFKIPYLQRWRQVKAWCHACLSRWFRPLSRWDNLRPYRGRNPLRSAVVSYHPSPMQEVHNVISGIRKMRLVMCDQDVSMSVGLPVGLSVKSIMKAVHSDFWKHVVVPCTFNANRPSYHVDIDAILFDETPHVVNFPIFQTPLELLHYFSFFFSFQQCQSLITLCFRFYSSKGSRKQQVHYSL